MCIMRRAMQQTPAIDIETHILIETSSDRAIIYILFRLKCSSHLLRLRRLINPHPGVRAACAECRRNPTYERTPDV